MVSGSLSYRGQASAESQQVLLHILQELVRHAQGLVVYHAVESRHYLLLPANVKTSDFVILPLAAAHDLVIFPSHHKHETSELGEEEEWDTTQYERSCAFLSNFPPVDYNAFQYETQPVVEITKSTTSKNNHPSKVRKGKLHCFAL